MTPLRPTSSSEPITDHKCQQVKCRENTRQATAQYVTLAELVERADDELFDKVLINSGHVLYSILPR